MIHPDHKDFLYPYRAPPPTRALPFQVLHDPRAPTLDIRARARHRAALVICVVAAVAAACGVVEWRIIHGMWWPL
jgi:hypothetical protein